MEAWKGEEGNGGIEAEAPGNAFRDRALSAGAVRLFGLLCGLDRGRRGCFARRETLARMVGQSVSSVNHQIALLKRRGYITVTRRGRQPGEPGVIRVAPEARASSGMCLTANLQPVANAQGAENSDLEPVANLQSGANLNLQPVANMQGVTDFDPQPVANLQPVANMQSVSDLDLQPVANLQDVANSNLQPVANTVKHEVVEEVALKTPETTNSYQENPYSVAPRTKGGTVVVAKAFEKSVSDFPDRVPEDTFPEAAEAPAPAVPHAPTPGVSPAGPDPPAPDASTPHTSQGQEGLTGDDPEVRVAARELEAAGLVPQVALELARCYGAGKVRAAIRYVREGRGEPVNPPGYIRFLLETNVRFPEWCYPAGKPDEEAPKKPAGSRSAPDRVQERCVSPEHDALWKDVRERIRQKIQPCSFASWIDPLQLAGITDGAVVLRAPDREVAEWVAEHYLWLVHVAMEEAGVACASLAVTPAPYPGRGRDV